MIVQFIDSKVNSNHGITTQKGQRKCFLPFLALNIGCPSTKSQCATNELSLSKNFSKKQLLSGNFFSCEFFGRSLLVDLVQSGEFLN